MFIINTHLLHIDNGKNRYVLNILYKKIHITQDENGARAVLLIN